MKKTLLCLSLLALSMTTGLAHARDVGVTASIGTTGLGLHVSTPITPSVNARVGLNAYTHNDSGSTSDVDYRFKLKLSTLDVLADWFPLNNGFRVSGGLVYNANKVTASGQANSTGTYTINGNTYNAASAGQLDGQIDFRKVAPYLGIGWGNAVAKEKGWGFSADLGVMLHGTPDTALTNTGCTAPAAVCDQLARDVAVERTRLHDKVDGFKAYPVVRLGASYRF